MKYLFGCLLILLVVSCTKKMAQQTKPSVSGEASAELVAESNINIPIQISLKAINALAEKNIDTVFTSPNYPNDWVNADCATRYKYYFRRSPLRMSASGTTMNLAFTGFYKIIGSTRVCAGNTVLSPWTPPCSCGFDEGERKVNIGFNSSFKLHSNHILNVKIDRTEPQPLNKCSVCFWGHDITNEVLKGLKEELDLAKKAIEDSFKTVNLRPYLQLAWNKLNEAYSLPGLGYLSLNPKKIRMENISANNDLLNINLGVTATPGVSFIKKHNPQTAVPDLSSSANKNGFNIHLEAALQYDSLSKVINGYLANKRFELSEGIIKKHVIIKDTKVYSDGNGNLVIEVDFGGSHSGTIFFNGKPTYNATTKKIEVEALDYDLKTNSFLLKTAKWLFDKKIISEIKKYTTFDLSGYYETGKNTMNAWLNKEWTKGVKGVGSVQDLKLTGLHALPQHLLIRSNCVGDLSVVVNEIDLGL